MIICLAVILFILIRKFPQTAELDQKVEKNRSNKVVETKVSFKEEPVKEEKPKYDSKVESFLHSAQSLIEDNKLQVAEEKLIEAIQLDIKCATAYTLLGDIYLKRHRAGEAEEAYRAAIKHNSEDASAHFGLGVILEDAGKLNEAVKEVAAAIKIDSSNDVWYFRLGEIYMNLRMFSKAGMAYNRAANLKPDYSRYKELALLAERKQISHKT